jgi:hypothetical protein
MADDNTSTGPSLQQVVDSPNFYSLPRGEQFKVLRTFPSFSGMPLHEQGSALAKLQQQHAGSYGAGETPEQQQDKGPGFWSTIGSRLAGGVSAMAHPVESAVNAGVSSAAQVAKGAGLVKKGEVSEGLGRIAGGVLPFSGPQAIQAGEEFGEGKTGAGAADALLAILPFMREPLMRAGGSIKAMTEPLSGVEDGVSAPKAKTPSLVDTAKTGASRIKIPFLVKLAIKRIPGGSTALHILENLAPEEAADAAQKYQAAHGKLPETWEERVRAANEYAAYKKADAKLIEQPKPLTPKAQAAADEAAKAKKIADAAARYRAESGPPKRFDKSQVKPANVPEGTTVKHAAPEVGKPRPKLKPKTEATGATKVTEAPDDEVVKAGKLHRTFVNNVNARLGPKLKSAGITPEQVESMTPAELKRLTGHTFTEPKFDAEGERLNAHRGHTVGTQELAKWMRDNP